MMDKVMLLHKSGKVEESLQLALRIAKSNPDDWVLLSRVALFIIQNNHYHIFWEAVKILKKLSGTSMTILMSKMRILMLAGLLAPKAGALRGHYV